MLHFLSSAAENELSAAFDVRAGSVASLGTVALPEFSVSGIAQGSVLETARGLVLARDLRPGDRVVTRDNGLQPVRWVGTTTVMYDEPYRTDRDRPRRIGPARIRAGALGSNADAGNLILAPGQRLLARNAINECLFGATEVMAPAGTLTHLDGVDIQPRSVGRWSHILFDAHEMIRVNGLWMESFAPDMWAIRVAYPEHWRDITEALPRLRYDYTAANYIERRVSLDAREARLLDTI